MGTWNLLKAIASEKAGHVKKRIEGRRQKAVDLGLPLDIHLGSSITLDPTPFLIHGGALTVENPGRTCVVRAYGRINMAGITQHKFYLESDTDPHRSATLTLSQEGNGIEECRLFTSRDEVFPESAQEWEFWLDPREGYIGWPVFQDKDDNSYDRIWSAQSPGRSTPMEYNETVYMDPAGDAILTIHHTAMLYGRTIDPSSRTPEYLLVSAEAHSDDTAVVQISAGLDILPESLTINY